MCFFAYDFDCTVDRYLIAVNSILVTNRASIFFVLKNFEETHLLDYVSRNSRLRRVTSKKLVRVTLL